MEQHLVELVESIWRSSGLPAQSRSLATLRRITPKTAGTNGIRSDQRTMEGAICRHGPNFLQMCTRGTHSGSRVSCNATQFNRFIPRRLVLESLSRHLLRHMDRQDYPDERSPTYTMFIQPNNANECESTQEIRLGACCSDAVPVRPVMRGRYRESPGAHVLQASQGSSGPILEGLQQATEWAWDMPWREREGRPELRQISMQSRSCCAGPRDQT